MKNLLVWNYLANWDQPLMEWSLGGSLSELYPLDPRSIQDAAISGHSFNIGPYGKNNKNNPCVKLLDQLGPNWWNGPWMVPFQNCIRWTPGPRWWPFADIVFTHDPMGYTMKNLLIWNYLVNWDQNLLKWSFGSPLWKCILWTGGLSKPT